MSPGPSRNHKVPWKIIKIPLIKNFRDLFFQNPMPWAITPFLHPSSRRFLMSSRGRSIKNVSIKVRTLLKFSENGEYFTNLFFKINDFQKFKEIYKYVGTYVFLFVSEDLPVTPKLIAIAK